MSPKARLYLASIAAYQTVNIEGTDKKLIKCNHTAKILMAANIHEALEGLTSYTLAAWKQSDGYSNHSIYLEPLQSTFFESHLDMVKKGMITFDHDPAEKAKLYFVDEEFS